jgi:hypothetical protein
MSETKHEFSASLAKDAESAGHHDLHTTGLHQHNCDFQMFYVLNGWIKFVYEGQGEKIVHETVVVELMPETAAAAR